uniref:Ig-like domain-containing protein n=1 Tax=Seriola dumerili TaxID=41447 RepID=A0A3B4U9J9_SERDU
YLRCSVSADKKRLIYIVIYSLEGSCVVVPCQTQPHSQVNWYQYHTLHYPVVYDKLHPDKIEEQFRGRTSVQGNAADGNCTLMIDNVRGDDNNLQVYVWIYPALKEQRFYDQTVTIFVGKHAPIISIQKKIVDGEFFQANCSIRHSCPFKPPPLHWNVAIKEGFSRNETFSQKVQGQWLYTEMLHGWATYEMHNSIMTCSAQFASFTTESEQITLSILCKCYTSLSISLSISMILGSLLLFGFAFVFIYRKYRRNRLVDFSPSHRLWLCTRKKTQQSSKVKRTISLSVSAQILCDS